MKKKTFLKSLSFTSLALLMGAAGVFAFAPLGANPSVASASEMTESTTTSGLGLDPKKDPIVYTTESGLEIRMSNASKYSGTTTTTTNRGYTYTQDLTSFYYFTMGTYSGTIYTGATKTSTYTVSNAPVNWIILGLGPNTTYFLDEVTANLFSTWKTNTSTVNRDYTNITANGPYFFQEVFESTTPAGSAINSVVPSKSYVMEKVKASIPSDPADEIPDGCMLVISEKLLGQMYFNSTNILNADLFKNYEQAYAVYGSLYYGNRYRFYSNQDASDYDTVCTWTINNNKGGDLYNYINSLFSKNTSGSILKNSLGFTQTQADLIVPQQLYTYYYNGGSHLQETPSTDGGTYYTMFPLAKKSAYSSIYQNFCIENYLSSNASRISAYIGTNNNFFYYLRSGDSNRAGGCQAVLYSGAYETNVGINRTYGVRPAMVMRLQ